MKRLAALAGVVVVCLGTWLVIEGRNYVELRNLDDVRLGMTEQEVEALIGKPNGYNCGPGSHNAGFGRVYVTTQGKKYIQYDGAGKVVGVGTYQSD
jgi:hypothetical protein